MVDKLRFNLVREYMNNVFASTVEYATNEIINKADLHSLVAFKHAFIKNLLEYSLRNRFESEL